MTTNKMRIEPLRREMLNSKVADAICALIRQNGLDAGERLPAERELALKLKTGRNTVRSALKLLEAEGVVRIVAGKGAYVLREPDGDRLELRLMRVDYRDLLEIKIWLEQLAIRRAIERATPAQLKRLDEAARVLTGSAQKGLFSLEEDHAFHMRLLECGGSATLAELVSMLIEALDKYAGVIDDAKTQWVQTIPYHADIAAALRARRLDEALAAQQEIWRRDMMVMNGMKIREDEP